MDYDYKIFRRDINNAGASAVVYYLIDKTEVFLHPVKCTKCHKFFDGVEYQTIIGINHEVQESLVLDILMKERGEYENNWFDKTCQKSNGIDHEHQCKGIRGFFLPHRETLHGSGYFR